MKLIYVEWQDAYAGNSWLTEEEVKGLIESEMIVRQSGFVFHEDDKRIVLVSKISDCDENIETEYGSIHVIPKTWVKKRVDLTEYINNPHIGE